MNSFLYIILCPFTNVTFSHAVEGVTQNSLKRVIVCQKEKKEASENKLTILTFC
jgi:hypothetical protein